MSFTEINQDLSVNDVILGLILPPSYKPVVKQITAAEERNCSNNN